MSDAMPAVAGSHSDSKEGGNTPGKLEVSVANRPPEVEIDAAAGMSSSTTAGSAGASQDQFTLDPASPKVPDDEEFSGSKLHPVRAAIQRGKSRRFEGGPGRDEKPARRPSRRIIPVDAINGSSIAIGEGNSVVRDDASATSSGGGSPRASSEESKRNPEGLSLDATQPGAVPADVTVPAELTAGASLADLARQQTEVEMQNALDSEGGPRKGAYKSKRMSQWLGVQKPLRRISVLHKVDGDSERHRFVLDPRSPFRRVWDAITAGLVLYLCFIVPMVIGFSYWHPPAGIKSFSIFLDIWFIIDIILNFRTGYVDLGFVKMDPREIRKHYLQGWFIVDFTGSIPFDWFIGDEIDIRQTTMTARKSLKTLKYFKLAKLLRLGRIVRFLRKYARYYGIFLIAFCFIFASHFMATMWVAVLDPCDGSDLVSNYKLVRGPCSQENVWTLYAAALHDGIATMLGVMGTADLILLQATPRGDVSLDDPSVWLWKSFVLVFGLVLACLFLASVNVLFANFASASYAFRRKIEGIKSEMHYYNLPPDLQRKINAYYEYMWINQKHFGDSSLLKDKDMSLSLKQDVTLYLYKEVIRDVPFFKDIEDDRFLCNVCARLKTRIYLPKDFIIIHGDNGDEMFILSKGKCVVLNDVGQELANLQKGDFFGEVALIYHSRRSATVQAVSISEVSVLTFGVSLMLLG